MPTPSPSSPFYRTLHDSLSKRDRTVAHICPEGDDVARRVLHDYGAMFVGSDDILPPTACVFASEDQVSEFQNAAGVTSEKIGDAVIELQPPAMKALVTAGGATQADGLDITPRDGAEAARRSYADTARLWNSRFLPALDHWTKVGRLPSEEANRLRALPINQQVSSVLELEEQGVFFSKDLSKSELYSIAAPGTSQHIAMLAFDANEFLDARVREIMAEHGWFQTVLSDLPHFTFLGLQESELPQRGLKPVEVNNQKFWIPDV